MVWLRGSPLDYNPCLSVVSIGTIPAAFGLRYERPDRRHGADNRPSRNDLSERRHRKRGWRTYLDALQNCPAVCRHGALLSFCS
jgi:hypothetical protein